MKTKTITQPTTPDGVGTCRNRNNNDVCPFLESKWGKVFTCFYAYGSHLRRDNETGFLKPCAGCFFDEGE